MKLKTGLYQTLIHEKLSELLEELQLTHEVDQSKLEQGELPDVLAQYLGLEVLKTLRSFTGKDASQRQTQLTNEIISILNESLGESLPIELLPGTIPVESKILLSVKEKSNQKSDKVSRPLTPLNTNTLFTSSKRDPKLFTELVKEIDSSDEIDLLVSFIKMSGFNLLRESLERFTSSKKLRVITTSYMGASDAKAIHLLAQLPNTEVKVSYDKERTRLHAKAYLFKRLTGFTTAYIGSSNLSHAAVTEGLEWNVKASSIESPQIIEKFQATFDTYWDDQDFELYNPDTDYSKLQVSLSKVVRSLQTDNSDFYFSHKPYAYQQAILDKLEHERKVHGRFKNLVVAATGTGKTVIAAFDFKRFFESHSKNAKLLFVAHREEILKQSLSCFRQVLGDHNFGELLTGKHYPGSMDNVFASTGSLHRLKSDPAYSSGMYDYIIVDEMHHGAADSYQTIFNDFQSNILLGLTATPERMDGQDITQYFDGKFAAEIRLFDALDKKLLTPFHYYCISDEYADLSAEKYWKNGKFNERELSNLFSASDARAKHIFKAVAKYIANPLEMKALGFCVDKKHAEFMAEQFNKLGIPAQALTSDSKDSERAAVQSRLKNSDINVIFVVDIYNEGVDIKEIDTVLFLRPTQSLTIFLQQLGRGLRFSEGKDQLTVLDFIGQVHKNYSFHEKFLALAGGTTQAIEDAIATDFPYLPSGCAIKFERVAKETILHNIKRTLSDFSKQNLKKKIKNFKVTHPDNFSLEDFAKVYPQLQLDDVFCLKDSWTTLQYNSHASVPNSYPLEVIEANGLRRLAQTDSLKFLEYIDQVLKGEIELKQEEDSHLLSMFFHTLFGNKSEEIAKEGRALGSVQSALNSKEFCEELCFLVNRRFQNLNHTTFPLLSHPLVPLEIHASYTRDQVLAAFGYSTLSKKAAFREGVKHLKDHKVDLLFNTINKVSKRYSPSTMYKDYAISDSLFHWESQSTTSLQSPTGQRYINPPDGHEILLFVRENQKKSRKSGELSEQFVFLGPVKCVQSSGSNPVSIVWKLDYPIPGEYLKKFVTAVA